MKALTATESRTLQSLMRRGIRSGQFFITCDHVGKRSRSDALSTSLSDEIWRVEINDPSEVELVVTDRSIIDFFVD